MIQERIFGFVSISQLSVTARAGFICICVTVCHLSICVCQRAY